MKKKVLLFLGVFALVGVNLYLTTPSDVSLDDIALSNIDAMAQYENTQIMNHYLTKNTQTMCKVCTSGGPGCFISSQCCKSWGNCWF